MMQIDTSTWNFEQKLAFEESRQKSENFWSVFELDFHNRFYNLNQAIEKELNAASDDAYEAMFNEAFS